MYCTHEDAPACGCLAEMRADAYYFEPEYVDQDDLEYFHDGDSAGDAADWECNNGNHQDRDGTDTGWVCINCEEEFPLDAGDPKCGETVTFWTPDGMETYSGDCGLRVEHRGEHGAYENVGQ